MKESIFHDTMVEMTWQQIEEKGKEGATVLFPLGVIEEHGPHLPLGTDMYMSLMVCKKIKKEAMERGKECLIAPPYYWGINHCTGAFPGCFSVRPETMKSILFDIFNNLKQFGFQTILCVNQHGDLSDYGLSGQEELCFVDGANYPELIDPQIAKELPDYSLTYDMLETWLNGGEEVKEIVPLGYAGDPARFEEFLETSRKIFEIMCTYIAEQL